MAGLKVDMTDIYLVEMRADTKDVSSVDWTGKKSEERMDELREMTSVGMMAVMKVYQ